MSGKYYCQVEKIPRISLEINRISRRPIKLLGEVE